MMRFAMMRLALAAAAAVAAAATAPTACPPPLTVMATFHEDAEDPASAVFTACEDLSVTDGAIVLSSAFGQRHVFRKRAESIYGDSTAQFSADMQTVWESSTDTMRNHFLNVSSVEGRDVHYAEIAAAISPLLLNGGTLTSMAAKAMPSHVNVHTFTGSRGSLAIAAFDHQGADSTVGDMDYPGMSQEPAKYGRSKAIFKDALLCSHTGSSNTTDCPVNSTLGGLIGGHLPVLHFAYARVEGGWIFMDVAPAPESPAGFAQIVLFRFLRLAANGTVLDAQYYDTVGYSAGAFQTDAASETAHDFYRTLLAQERYWGAVLSEGMAVSLPSTAAVGTDGQMLSDFANHSLIRSMITRSNTYFPNYGVLPQMCEYSVCVLHPMRMHSHQCTLSLAIRPLAAFADGLSGHGFQEVFANDLMMALEAGLFEYSRGILDNYLSFYVRRGGAIFYRGLEMHQQGRMLTLLALYHSYTGDAELLLNHSTKISGVIGMLRERRNRALALPTSDYAWGMPTGNDEADSGISTFECMTTVGSGAEIDYPNGTCVTELPFVSIAAEMYRGFLELGRVYSAIGASPSQPQPALAAEGARLLSEAAALHSDLVAAMRRSSFPPRSPGGPRQYPHVFGWEMEHDGPRNVKGYRPPTVDVFVQYRTFPEVFYSSALPLDVMADIADDYAARGALRLNVWSYAFASHHSGQSNSAMWAYTVHGWGHGLLLLDRVEDFLIMLYALAAHAHTRGTWTAAEISSLERSTMSSGYCVPTQTLVPLYLKWMLVWEDPVERVLWLGKAVPRDWLERNSSNSGSQLDHDSETAEVSNGKGRVVVDRATTRYGRLSFTLWRESVTTLHANITLSPPPFAATSALLPSFPPGGLKVRVRVPMDMVLVATSAGVLNATEQTVSFDRTAWAKTAVVEPGVAQVQAIVVTLRCRGECSK
jgi:hypothetical protein